VSVRFPLALAVALLVPLCIATVGIVWVAAGERVGAAPFAGLVPRNSAEAAALGSAGDLLRLLRRGEDPHGVYTVRPDVMSSAILRATTLEAAMWSRQREMIQLLDREGAIDGDRERRALACLAADLRIEDVVEYLAPEGVGDCEPGQALERVVARTSRTGGEQ
jgi:hypothetical protein